MKLIKKNPNISSIEAPSLPLVMLGSMSSYELSLPCHSLCHNISTAHQFVSPETSIVIIHRRNSHPTGFAAYLILDGL